jgi:uracil-DNA glycosylase family 4
MSEYNDLIFLLKNGTGLNHYVLYRNKEELDSLVNWLSSPVTAVKNPETDLPDQSIMELIKKCRKCGNVSDINLNIGSGENRVMIILNPPRLLNRLELRVLKKESEELFNKMISAAGLEISKCYTTSLVKCESDDFMMKPSRMVENCLEILTLELEKVNPLMVLVMGDIMPLQKIIHESVGIIWHNIDHPITLIKTPDLKRKAWNTIKIAMAAFKKNK